MQNEKKQSFLDDRRWMALISLVTAVIIWLIITMFYSDSTTFQISGKSVDFGYDSTKYTDLGLDIVNEPVYNVTVTFSGTGTTIGQIKQTDFVVYPDYSSVRGPGETTLPLLVKITNSSYGSSVTAVVENRDKYVDVVFDNVGEKVLPVTISSTNLKLADGYIMNKQVATPSEVTVSGPENEIEKVSSVVAQLSVDGLLSESATVSAVLIPQDSDGNPVDLVYASLSAETCDITLSVYQLAELPVTVNFINVPTGFDTSTLRYKLDPLTMRVSGPTKQVSALENISVTSFDLSNFQLDRSYQLAVQLPNGLVSQDGLTNVTLNFDTTGMASKTVNVTNIRVVNEPAGYSISVETERIYNVTLVGPAEQLESLAASQVEALVDASDISVTEGRENIPVTITVPSSDSIFATGSYTVQCSVGEDN